jgi:hypothetical protein
MRAWGDYGDVLRLIGKFLDDQQAQERQTVDPEPISAAPAVATVRTEHVAILNHGGTVTLSWQLRSSSGRQSLCETDISRMRALARSLRTGTDQNPTGDREESFRTFGQLLEIQGADIHRIVETAGGLNATGVIRGEPLPPRMLTRRVADCKWLAQSAESSAADRRALCG